MNERAKKFLKTAAEVSPVIPWAALMALTVSLNGEVLSHISMYPDNLIFLALLDLAAYKSTRVFYETSIRPSDTE